MLGALLRDVRNIRSTASDAADSNVSALPGDQNRGETHATPEQTEVGTPRAAANRPVRSERADPRRHAGVVRTTDGDAVWCLSAWSRINLVIRVFSAACVSSPNQAGMPPMVGAFSANRSICCGTRRADLCLLWRSMGLSLILVARER